MAFVAGILLQTLRSGSRAAGCAAERMLKLGLSHCGPKPSPPSHHFLVRSRNGLNIARQVPENMGSRRELIAQSIKKS